jgi:hypothetical protein
MESADITSFFRKLKNTFTSFIYFHTETMEKSAVKHDTTTRLKHPSWCLGMYKNLYIYM